MIELGLKTLALLLSFYGYFLWVEKKGIDIAFAPVLTVSGIGVAMFFAGILNIMPLAVWLLFITGIICFFFNLRKSLLIFPILRTTTILMLFGILYFLLALRLRGEMILEYDNFSHWLLVLKDMLQKNALPNYASALIEFQSYPTGTAGFLYYVCLILGDTEGVILFGQAILLLSCVMVFWVFIQKTILLSSLVAGLCSIYLFIGNISILDLSVDSVLSLLGIATFAVLIYYQTNTTLAAICSGIIGSYLLLVKNSGIFFLIIHALLLLWFELRQNKSLRKPVIIRNVIQDLVFALLIPLVISYLWNRHVAYVYPDGDISKHSMTIANYTNIWGEKTTEDVTAILHAFQNRILSPGAEGFLLLVLVGIYGVGCILQQRQSASKGKEALGYLCWSALIYISYLVGLAAMYLFSMPYDEAISLGSFDRYLSTITMYLISICCIYLLTQLSTVSPTVSFRILAPLAMLLFLWTVSYRLPTLFSFAQDYSDTTRGTLQRIQAEYDIYGGASYYLVGERDYGYLYWVARYEFWSPAVTTKSEPDASKYPDFYDRFDYVILLIENDATEKFLEDLGLPAGQQAYRLSDYQ